MKNELSFDVVIIGGGHAGCEAAAAAARIGVNTALFTHKFDTIGEMSCNPAIGGLGKGHLVREIDALDGVMGEVADKSGIQFRLLNRSRGPAVRGPRTQSDRSLYKKYMQEKLVNYCNLSIISDPVIEFIFEKNNIIGFITQEGKKVLSSKVILTTGTFLNGLIHIGNEKTPAGRFNEKPSTGLSEQLEKYDFKIGRLKTGTPPRLDATTINFEKLEEQHADEDPYFFSFLTKKNINRQISCRMTYTNQAVHEIISKNIKSSAMYSGSIQGVGPRYCPSIEDKINRFSDKSQHQVFVEPEGWNTVEVYVNGFSTSLPDDIQYKALKQVKGFENVKFFRPGYAIEYDYFPPTQLYHSLETKRIQNLFFAGQINGTTGYEEAGAQGIMAGINAHLKSKDKTPFILGREEAYIGVLIDDLILKGTDEPYRMFTSRAEYRTLLRQDNADQRLTPKAHELGLASDERMRSVERKQKKGKDLVLYLKKSSYSLAQANKILRNKNDVEVRQTDKFSKLLSRPNIKRNDLLKFKSITSFLDENAIDDEIFEQAEIEIKYAGYIDKEKRTADKLKRLENIKIPPEFDYERLASLSHEAKEKLNKIQPTTLAQASRISGINPSDISVLLVSMGR